MPASTPSRSNKSTAADDGWFTTWPVLAEATHLMTRWLGTRFACALMDDVAAGGVAVGEPPQTCGAASRR